MDIDGHWYFVVIRDVLFCTTFSPLHFCLHSSGRATQLQRAVQPVVKSAVELSQSKVSGVLQESEGPGGDQGAAIRGEPEIHGLQGAGTADARRIMHAAHPAAHPLAHALAHS